MSSIVENTIFTKQAINFDPVDLNTQLVPVPLKGDIKFGILNLKVISCPLTQEKLEFIFQLDRSGSMSDPCADGRTKMQHIIHTMSNIVTYFRENSEINAFITINAFDDQLYSIVKRTNVTEDNYKKIIGKIDSLTPKGSTDIGKALTSVRETSTKLREQFPDHKQVHVFMTDGQITQGISKHETLRELVDTEITNAFIGFGLDHDAALLNALSSGANSNYYFIDKLENAGLVYGEILHGVVYRFLLDVVINISEGLIYNFKTNEWTNSLAIGEIVSESDKTYHIVSNAPAICSAELTCKKVSDGTEVNAVIIREDDIDLTKYLYRQRTQQILYKVKDFISKNNKENYEDLDNEKSTLKTNMKTTMTNYFKELKKYMEDNNLSDDIFYKNLCDDIYICIRTFDTCHGIMYVTSRADSQGQQRAYNTNNIPRGIPRRQHARSFVRCNALDLGANNHDDEDENDDTLQYEVSQSVTTPYRSCSQTAVMRVVSNNINDTNDVSEDEEEFTLPV